MNYPTKKKITNNNKIVSRANQGMALEEMINLSNIYYDNHNIAFISKRPTPIKVLETSSKYEISKAVFMQASTLDYVGIYKGKYLDFEAKETKNVRGFPMNNIASHQIEAMEKILANGGITFALIFMSSYNEVYLIEAPLLINYYNEGITTLKYETIKEKGHLIKESLCPVNYLKVVDEIYSL